MNIYSHSSKILSDVLKENKRRNSKHFKGFREKFGTGTVYQGPILNDLNIESCSYCNKVFSDSRCLLKHILRRHADHLLRMQGQYVKSNKLKKSTENDLRVKLSPNVRNDVTDIKKLLNDFKVEILEQLHVITHNRSTDGTYLNTHQEIQLEAQKQSIKKEVQQLCLELNELKAQCQHFETMIQNLEEKYEVSLEAVRRKIITIEQDRQQSDSEIKLLVRNALKAQKKETTAVKEEFEKQFTILHQALFHELQKQTSYLHDKLKSFENNYLSDIQTLQTVTKQIAARLERVQNDYNIEERFEKHLRSYLNMIPKKSKKTRSSMKKCLHTSSVMDFQQVDGATNPCSFPEINHRPDNPHLIYKLPQHSGEKFFSKRRDTQSVIKISAKKDKHKPLFITKRIKFALQKDPNILDGMFQEITKELENKLHVYGVLPGQTKLSASEFETVKQLIDENLKTYNRKDFINLQSKIDDLVTRKAKLYLSKNEREKKNTHIIPESVEELSDIDNVAFKRPFRIDCDQVNSLSRDLSDIENDYHNTSVSFDLQSVGDITRKMHGNLQSRTFTVATEDMPLDFKCENSHLTTPKLLKSSNNLRAKTLSNASTDLDPIKVKSPHAVQESEIIKVENESFHGDDNRKNNCVHRELNLNDGSGQSNAADFGLTPPSFLKAQISNFDSESNKSNSESKSSLETLSNWESD